MFSELTVTPERDIADIQSILSTRPSLRSLKIFVNIGSTESISGLLPAVFNSRTLQENLEELVIAVLEGQAPYSLEQLYGLRKFRRLRYVAIDGPMKECEELSLVKFLAYWFPQMLEAMSYSWGDGTMRSTTVLKQLPWLRVFSAERDVESLGILQHPGVEYISFDLLTALEPLEKWSGAPKLSAQRLTRESFRRLFRPDPAREVSCRTERQRVVF